MIADLDIAAIFNATLGASHKTVLLGGGDEPVYFPSVEGRESVILYTRDYVRSVLHELAHWSLAGEKGRSLLDYGCKYNPPPRTLREQQGFFLAELKVQALEKRYCDILDIDFCVSSDAFGIDCTHFAIEVESQASNLDLFSLPKLSGAVAIMLKNIPFYLDCSKKIEYDALH